MERTALILAAVAALAGPEAQAQAQQRSRVISFADLDLASTGGARLLRERLPAAAPAAVRRTRSSTIL